MLNGKQRWLTAHTQYLNSKAAYGHIHQQRKALSRILTHKHIHILQRGVYMHHARLRELKVRRDITGMPKNQLTQPVLDATVKQRPCTVVYGLRYNATCSGIGPTQQLSSCVTFGKAVTGRRTMPRPHAQRVISPDTCLLVANPFV